jgi:hypothetical protein
MGYLGWQRPKIAGPWATGDFVTLSASVITFVLFSHLVGTLSSTNESSDNIT